MVGRKGLPEQFAMAFSAVRFAIVFGEVASSKGIHAESTNEMLRMPLLIESIDTSSSDGLSTTRAQRASLLVIVDLTVRLPSKLVESTTRKVLLAVLANKVFRMPLCSQGIDGFTADGLVASSTSRNKRRVEALLAERTSVSLKEAPSFEWTQTLGADEVVYMPLLSNGSDATIKNGFVTVSTARAEQLLVALLTVRNTVLLKEVVGSQGIAAVATAKVFWMERLAQCLYHFSEYRLAALCTGP